MASDHDSSQDGDHAEHRAQSWAELPFTEKCDVLLLVVLYLLQGAKIIGVFAFLTT